MRTPIDIGFIPASITPTAWTLALNSANTWAAMSFVMPSDKTLNKILFYCSGVTGSLGANDIVVDIYSDLTSTGNQYKPDASLASRNVVTSTPTGAGWVEVTGFSLALSKGTVYHIVLKNANATPASNYFTVGGVYNVLPYPSCFDFWRQTTTDGGATWANQNQYNAGFRLEFSDGSFFGFPVYSVNSPDTDYVYVNRELGVRITTPASVKFNIRRINFPVSRTGSPTGNLRYRLYDNSGNLIATTATLPAVGLSTSARFIPLDFASVQTLDPETTYIVSISESSQSDSSSNVIKAYTFNIENSTASKALVPESIKKVYTTDATASPITWTESDTVIIPVSLGLEKGGEFTAVSSGSAVQRSWAA